MILVTGATGTVGRRVVEILAKQGRAVRALVREPEAAARFEAHGVTAFVGDVTRSVDRAQALTGVETVIACHTAYHSYGTLRLDQVDRAATLALIHDSAAAGVKHFTLLSHLHADRHTASLRFASKLAAEQALQSQPGLGWTILRLAPLMSELAHLPGIGQVGAQRGCLLFGPGRNLIAPVSPDDVAQIATRCAATAGAQGQVIDVAGPEAYAWSELPALLARAWEAPVPSWHLPLVVLSLLRYLFGWFSPNAGDRIAYLETLYQADFVADPGRLGLLFGLPAEDLVSYLRRVEEGAPAPEPTATTSDQPPPRAIETPSTDDDALLEPEPDLPARTTELPLAPAAVAADESDDEPHRTIEHAPLAVAESTPVDEPPASMVPESLAEPRRAVIDADELPAVEPVPPTVEPADELEPLAAPAAVEEPAPVDEPEPADEPEPIEEPVQLTEPAPLDVAEPEPAVDPETVDPAEPALSVPAVGELASAADETDADWGHHAEFEAEPDETETALDKGKRPRVERPARSDFVIIDRDPLR